MLLPVQGITIFHFIIKIKGLLPPPISSPHLAMLPLAIIHLLNFFHGPLFFNLMLDLVFLLARA